MRGRIVKNDLSKRANLAGLPHEAEVQPDTAAPETALSPDETETRRLLRELRDHQALLEWQVEERTAELARYRNYLRTFLDNLPMLAWLKDTEGRFLMVNQLFAEAVGRSWQEIIGLTDLDVWPRELAEAYRADDRVVMASRTRKQVEECIESARGGGCFETFKSPLIDSGGDVIGTAGNARDITERKQAEEALQKAHDELDLRVRERTEKLTMANEYLLEEIQERQKAEEALWESSVRFKMVLDGLDALVYVADMETYRVLLVNRYGREIWGDLTGEICWRRLQVGQTGPCSFCTNSRLLDASGAPAEPVVWEFRNTVTERWYECRDQAIRWTDGRLVRMEIATDITERKRAEAEILSLNAELEQRVRQRTAQIEAVNKDLEAFSYTVSHDLRTPLVWIGGYSRLILKRYADRLDERPLQYLREICEGTQYMENLIDDLLDFSRLAYHELRREPVDLSALARTVAVELAQAEPERRATFRIADGVIVDGDPHLLLVVLKNLLGNAWKYTGKRENALIEFGMTHRHGKRACFVRDNGAGFDMALAAKLFIPFQRLHGSDEFKGHGIGLATVQRIIRHHEGEVWAESRQGEGTTFYFTLGTGEV